jgi:antitoxin component of MazEF toxin-antitoxin module
MAITGVPAICKINWWGNAARLTIPQRIIDELDLRSTDYVQLNVFEDGTLRIKKVTYGTRKRRIRSGSET